jgi:hypothetical protein
VNLSMGGQRFENVSIPVLWGTRAIIQDHRGRLGVIDLGEASARLEIVADKPAPGVKFAPRVGGFAVLDRAGTAIYTFLQTTKQFMPGSLELPELEVSSHGIRVGTNTFSGNMVSGFGVGIAIETRGITIGAPLPAGLAPFVVA